LHSQLSAGGKARGANALIRGYAKPVVSPSRLAASDRVALHSFGVDHGLLVRLFCRWHDATTAHRFSHEIIAELNGVAPPTSFVHQRLMKINHYSVVQHASAKCGVTC
jgi:hypothetical protein